MRSMSPDLRVFRRKAWTNVAAVYTSFSSVGWTEVCFKDLYWSTAHGTEQRFSFLVSCFAAAFAFLGNL